MRARAWSLTAVCALVATAAADPKPKAVDIKPFRDQLLVLLDADGGSYVVLPGSAPRIFYGAAGKTKNLYEQVNEGRFEDGSTGRWDYSVWAPRVPGYQTGSVGRREDGTYFRYCGTDHVTELTPASTDKAKAILDKSTFLTTAQIRTAYMLGRDDSGVYYYVDVIRKQYGGKGYRVFVGKKGAMKQLPLTDVASDTAGDVFSTKTGDVRIVRDASDSSKVQLTWVKGTKKVPLTHLDVEANRILIFKDLGVYGFVGNLCEFM